MVGTGEATPTSWGTNEGVTSGRGRDGGRRRVDGMVAGAGEPTAKRAKVGEAEEEEDPLVRRREELVRLLQKAKANGKGNARAKKELVTLCADFKAKNEERLRRLPPELWEKIIVDESVEQNDLFALAMTCRFFREKQKDFGKKVKTDLTSNRLFELRKIGKMPSHTLGWFRWVCDTMEILSGYETGWSKERVKGAMYEGVLLNYAAIQGSVEILRWLIEEKGWELNKYTGWYAAMGGSVEVLEHLVDRGYEFDEWACCWAAKEGHLKALKFLRGLDPPCPWDERTCTFAAEGGHLEVLKFARGQDPPCPWDERTCARAAYGGHLEVLKFARGQDPPCPWDEVTCARGAYGGHLEVLKFARGQDPPCPWNSGTCNLAVVGGHLEVLKWLKDQDPPCPWRRYQCRNTALRFGHQHIVVWIDQQEDESDDEDIDLYY